MLTEECHLNAYLETHGIEVTDTDLGERIVQLRHEPPSHIVLPAIHLKKEDIGELFHEKLGTEKGAFDAKYLTEAARGHLRQKFMAAQAGLTGVNFAIAETGGVVVCTNEGNADMGTSLPRSTSPAWASKSYCPGRRISASFSVFSLAVRPGSPSPRIVRTSTVLCAAANCMW